jgi:solute carrier family 25 phosphate transporter 23/24/25/41
MGIQDAPSGGRSLASVGFAGAGVGTGSGGGYKDLLVMALPKDDGAKAVEVVGAGLPDVGEAVRVRMPLPFHELALVQDSPSNDST